MVVYEDHGNMVKAYSDAGKKIHGGFPEADYDVAYDPKGANRTYVEIDEYVSTSETSPVRSWTPLAIKRACGDRWPALKAALEAAGIFEDFLMAQELLEDDPAFMQGVAWARQEYGDAAVDAVLDAATIERMRDLDAAELQRRGM